MRGLLYRAVCVAAGVLAVMSCCGPTEENVEGSETLGQRVLMFAQQVRFPRQRNALESIPVSECAWAFFWPRI
jgi:hypothetical protein